jgi:hypothetical protein
LCRGLLRVQLGRAVALDRAAGTRDGVGDQIRYLGLRLAPSTRAVNPMHVNKQRIRSLFRYVHRSALALQGEYHVGFLQIRFLRGLYVSFFHRRASFIGRRRSAPARTFTPQPSQS